MVGAINDKVPPWAIDVKQNYVSRVRGTPGPQASQLGLDAAPLTNHLEQDGDEELRQDVVQAVHGSATWAAGNMALQGLSMIRVQPTATAAILRAQLAGA